MKVAGWTLEGALGRGARGAVLRGRGPAGEVVAVKLVQADGAPEVRERFAREAAALARVRHPNVVGVRDHGEAQGRLYLVMDLVEGESLGGLLARQGPLTPRAAVTLCLTLARALEQVHAAGLLHRDLKPDNVVVRATGEPVLVDFGLARDDLRGSLTRSGVLLGTPGFMPPEQAAGARADARADVYGLGATLYAALTGQAPHEGDSLPELLVATAKDAPATPSSRVAGASGPEWRELDRLVLRSLEKEPARRFQSARELGDALEAWLRARRNAQRRRRPRPLVAGLLLLGGALSLSALALFVVTQRGRPPAAAPGVAATASAGPAPTASPVEGLRPADDDRRRRADALLDRALACDEDPAGLAAAAELVQQALALAPELGRGQALAALIGADRTRSRVDQEAALAALEAAAAAPVPWRGPEADRERGLLLHALGRHAEATRLLAPVMRARVDDVRVAWSVGVSARASDQPHLAVEAFGQVVRARGVRPGDWQLPFNLGGALGAIPHRVAEAAQWYDLAVQNSGGGGVPLLRRAQLLSALARVDEALAATAEAKGLGPKEADELAHVRVKCLLRLNRLDEALALARELHGRRPDLSHATQLAQVTWVATGEHGLAAALLEGALAREEGAGARGLLRELTQLAAPDDAADEVVAINERRLRASPDARDHAGILMDVLDLARSVCPAATRAFFCEREEAPRWAHRMSLLLVRVGLGRSGPERAGDRAAALVAAARCHWALEDRTGAFGLLDRAAREAPDDVPTKIARAELSLACFDLPGAAGLLGDDIPRLRAAASTDPLLLRAARMRVLLLALTEAESGGVERALGTIDALVKMTTVEPRGDEPGWRAFLGQARARLEGAR